MRDLNDILVFVNVIEAGSFSAAAERLGLPKSNISRKVSRLENELGIRLIERTTRTLHLTEAGRMYFDHAVRIKDELDYAEASISQMKGTPRGLIRVAASVTVGQQIIKPELSGFMRKYPDIRIDLELSNRRVDIVSEGIDLAIRVGELKDSSLVAKYLGTARLLLYASPEYLAGHAAVETPGNLLDHSCLHMSAVGSKAIWRLNSGSQQEIIEIEPILSVEDFDAIADAALGGLGVALLPHYIGDSLVTKGLLKPVLPGWEMESKRFYAVYPSHRGATPKLRVFLEYFYERIKTRLG
ncbi:hypothetical protein BTA51_16425 [Hahella sp. CCB-MM4]|uniref:LysR family transcriptional regulator n=1 Tax=Hahella sp. (strain CCB-MM4) TaxID=1926491 RepID=UPI000B9AA05E|nr:LysR family transcriptional regulator [Hahella sp. CCB-MM4]OZG72319.1 hypothetical protein BTA51_16425 [Hahella sp. CCB-MM4]